jgi:hypothetical protein
VTVAVPRFKMTEMKSILEMADRLKLEGDELKEFLEAQQEIQREEREVRREEIKVFEERKKMAEENIKLEQEKIADHAEARKLTAKIEEMKIEHQKAMETERLRLEEEKLKLEQAKEEDKKFGNLGKSKLPCFDETKDSFDAYIARFESFATLRKWKKEVWSIQLSLLLTGKALEVYDGLTIEQQGDYDSLKIALLRRFDLTEEAFRKKFFTTRPEKDETPSQFVVKLSRYLNRWIECTGIEKTFKSLLELLICERFLKQCHSELEAYLRESKHVEFSELAKVAERYIDAHGGSISESKVVQKKSKESKELVNDPKDGKHCKYCKKMGHDVSECRKLARKKEQETSSGKTDTIPRKCFVCGSKDHIAVNCPVRKDSGASALIGEDEFVDLDKEGNISTGSVNGNQLIVLRDTGCDVMVVKASLVRPEQYTGMSSNLELADGSKRSYPMAKVVIKTKYGKGEVTATVMPTPIYDLIVGNNLSRILECVNTKQFPENTSCEEVPNNPVVSKSVDLSVVEQLDSNSSVVEDGIENAVQLTKSVSPSRRKSLLQKARAFVKQKRELVDSKVS